jgi:hypothetical protein
MSVLHPYHPQLREEELHYCDGIHRWPSPDPERDEIWRTRLDAHLMAHRESASPGYAPQRWLGR